MKFAFVTIGRVGLTVALLAGAATGQGNDEALKDRVGQLVGRLDSEAADAAEKSLIELGPRILPLLSDAEAGAKPGARTRLLKVRAALVEAEEKVNLGASKVTLKGKGIRLTEAMKAFQTQTGNVITDLREQLGGDATNPALDLDIEDKPFFEALDAIAAKAGDTVTCFTGDGSVGLMAGGMEGRPPTAAKPRVVYSGPFRVEFKQVATLRDFSTGIGSANAQFEVAWEPRLRPMLMALKADGISVTTDEGKAVPPAVMMESEDVALRPENPSAELNINLDAPERSARELASVKIKGELTVPAGLRAFKFPSIAARNVVLKEGDITVTLDSTAVEEQVWRIGLVVAYPEGGPAFESYRQGLFNNRLWLQRADGSRFEHNGGFNNTGGGGAATLGFEYLFVDVPGKPSDYALVYETPSKVLSIPLEFEFKDVPLP